MLFKLIMHRKSNIAIASEILIDFDDGSMSNLTARVVGIHQPNFLPWVGYFDKILKSDVFIFLDDVQVPKKGGSWSNRSRILIGGRPQWITAPISRGSGLQRLNEVEVNVINWQEKIEETIRMAYRRAPYFDETMSVLIEAFSFETRRLSDWNRNAIQIILKHLGKPLPEIRLSSSLGVQSGSTQRLCELVESVGGTIYLSGNGSLGYLDEGFFEKRNIALNFQEFKQTAYPQLNTVEAHPGLSIVDALMMNGSEALADRLTGGEL